LWYLHERRDTERVDAESAQRRCAVAAKKRKTAETLEKRAPLPVLFATERKNERRLMSFSLQGLVSEREKRGGKKERRRRLASPEVEKKED
jgi:hypothetical protein